MIVEAEHPGVGTVQMLDAPIRLSATPPTIRRVPPRLGEHNVEVLLENGFDAETIERLQQLGVLDDRRSEPSTAAVPPPLTRSP